MCSLRDLLSPLDYKNSACSISTQISTSPPHATLSTSTPPTSSQANIAKGTTFDTKKGKKPSNNKKAQDPVMPAVKSKVARCYILELPAELRNRIYGFAQEKHVTMPRTCVQRSVKNEQNKIRSPSSNRQFLALAQTCKQLRSEYRPLWLRNSVLRLWPDDVRPYTNVFYHGPEEYASAPKSLFVAWDHRSPLGNDLLFDLTRLLELHAHRSNMRIEFVCQQLVDMNFWGHKCDVCGHSLQCDCDRDCDYDCSEDHKLQFEDLLTDVEGSNSYLEALNNFISNDDQIWLDCLRKHAPKGLKVECAVRVVCFPEEPTRPTIYIRFEKNMAVALDPDQSDGRDMHAKASRFLDVCGICNLEEYDGLDFVVGEETGKFTRPYAGCDYLLPTYNQIHISGKF